MWCVVGYCIMRTSNPRTCYGQAWSVYYVVGQVVPCTLTGGGFDVRGEAAVLMSRYSSESSW
eukprot:21157-Eustigmatos_ZCMA.PRE.1